MDGIADMGGTQGWGRVPTPRPEPVFAHRWQARTFALTLLAIDRIAGRNTDAFRHAIERLHPADYLADGYYGRWLRAAELMLTDSAILAPGAVDARARRLRGERVDEPPVPQPAKPDYLPAAPGSLRDVDRPPRFAVGDPVRTRDMQPSGHTRLARYLRRRQGIVRRVHGAAVFPDTNAHFLGEHPQHVYAVEFDSREVWGPDAEPFLVCADLYESYLEEAGAPT